VPWTLFEREASRYEAWYATPHGRRADQAECSLLTRLLRSFPKAHTMLEVGCGTGHFTAWLATQGWWVVGVDRAPAMLAAMRQRFPDIPVIIGDAHRLPVRARAVDLVIFVTTLEFLEDPVLALAEAVRVARQGLVLVTLNPWSLGGLSRRWGQQARGTLLSQAREYSVIVLRRLLRQAAGRQLNSLLWASTLFPNGFWRAQVPIPVGDVVGMAVRLH
jgi:ubiquinone/menaquinone biosynthesis C-methylase UbiE